MATEESSNYHDNDDDGVIALNDVDQQDDQQVKEQQQQHDKTTQGICLLFLSAFLFSFMGMFLQFTARMGLPSTELVFIRSVFQGTFVVIGMLIFRVDADQSNNSSKSATTAEPTENGENTNAEGVVSMVPIHGEVEEQIGYNITSASNCDEEEASLLLATTPTNKNTYGSTIPTTATPSSTLPPSLPPLIIQRPFGTNPTMCKIVILRGVIGGFGFCNYYYTLSTLPLGDATTLLSLYPIVTIFLARVVLGEEIKSLYIVAALASIVGAALISRPSFLFGSEEHEENGDDDGGVKLGYITALIGSFCASGVIVLIRKAGKVGAHTLQLLFSWTVFGVSFSLLLGHLLQQNQWRVPTRDELPAILGVCISGSIAHFLLNYAGKLVPATLAGLLRSSDIFWAYLIEIFVLMEHPKKATWWGVALVCSSLAMVLLASNEKSRNALKSLKSFGSVGNLTAVK